MIAVDTNILVYSHRRESRHHDAAVAEMRALCEGASRWAIPWPCVCEFFSVVTNPRIWKDASSTPDEAWAQIDAWTESPRIVLLNETGDFLRTLESLVRRPRVRGPIVHDARIAALCLAHGVQVLLSADRDFSLFPELRTRNPLTARP